MSLADICTVVISSTVPGPSAPGFGILLLLSPNLNVSYGRHAVVKASEWTADMQSLGFGPNTGEYFAAQAIFSQVPAPATLIIGRCAFKPIMSHTLAIKSVVSTAGTTYQFHVFDPAAAKDVIVSFTTVGSDTNDSIIAGLLAAWTAGSTGVTSFGITSSGATGSHILTVLGTAGGLWYQFVNANVDLLTTKQITADGSTPSITSDLTAIMQENNDWYAILCMTNSAAIAANIAAFAESNTKLFLCQTQDSDVPNQSGSGDIASTLSAANRARTTLIYHPDNSEFVDAAWAGSCLAFTPGQETWKFKTLSGVIVANLTPTHTTNMVAKHCNYYVLIAGKSITTEGIVSDNEYIDIVRGRDWLVVNLQIAVFGLLTSNPKVAYTDAGIALVQSAVLGVLATASSPSQGLLSPNPAPTCTVPKVASVSPSDKASRTLNNVNFTGVFAGAIHKLSINGAVSV